MGEQSCEQDGHIRSYVGATRLSSSFKRTSEYCCLMDGWLLPHCCSIRGNPARYFWHRQPRHGRGLAGHCEVVLSPVLVCLCRERADKAVRAIPSRISTLWSR